MNERKQMSVEVVRTDDLQIETPAFQHGFLSWLRELDSNQRPSGYTFPIIFIMAWTISSSVR
jgi:hypothetical protein